MKVKVIENHPGEGSFPTFEKGTNVTMKEEDTHFLHWHACDIAGYQTYVPRIFVCDGKLTRDYNPTELVQEAGDIIEVQEIVYAWLIATNEKGITGWIPAEAVVSVDG
jgi:hypothetical protein